MGKSNKYHDRTIYYRGLRALHNLHICLDESKSLEKGSLGFMIGLDPMESVVEDLEGLEKRLTRAISTAKKQ